MIKAVVFLRSKRAILLMLLSLVAAFSMLLIEPIPQDTAYHQFADQSTLYSIPNFWNVISNLPFLLVGVLGLSLFQNNINKAKGTLPELRFVYITFFIGVLLTSFGSSYYHWFPENNTLLWDRLPMTISFMAFFSIIIGENISVRLAKKLFYPLLLLGVISVIYWIITESTGKGDLRFYALIQFLPVILIPLILWLYPSKFNGQWYIVLVIVAYALAKLTEYFDQEIFDILGVMSGHAIKHVIAAIGTYFFYLAMVKRHRF